MRRTDDMWAYDIDLWPWRSPRLSVILMGSLLLVLVILRLFVFDLWAIGPTRLRVITWPLTLEVMAPAANSGRRPPFVYKVWSSYALPFERYGTRCVSALMGLVTLSFDLLTLKLVCELHLRWGTFLPNLGTLGLWVLELFAMYTTDGEIDTRTDWQKQRLIAPFRTGGSIITDIIGGKWAQKLVQKFVFKNFEQLKLKNNVRAFWVLAPGTDLTSSDLQKF